MNDSYFTPPEFLSNSLPNCQFGAKVLVLSQWQYVKWLSTTFSASYYLMEAGIDVEVVDISQYSFPYVGTPQNSLAIKLKLKSKLHKFVENLGFKYSVLDSRTRDTVISRERHQMIELDVLNQSKSFFKDTNPNLQKKFVKKYVEKNLERAINLYKDLYDLAKTENFTHCVIPNGRFAAQKVARYVMEDLNLSFSFLEVGTTKSIYWEVFTPHDRTMGQRYAEKFISSVDLDIVKSEYERWVLPRQHQNSPVNSFTKFWTPRSEINQKVLENFKNSNIFFTSSRDEFEALGREWKIDKWFDQYDAFDYLLEYFEGQEEKNILRIHPNLLNKSPNQIENELSRIYWLSKKHPKLLVLLPQSSINSYELLKSAKRVIISNSTIGLEASSMGIPVWNTSATYFDDVIDVRKIFSKFDINEQNLEPWKVNKFLGQAFIAYMACRERPIKFAYEFWSEVDPVIKYFGKRSSFIPAEFSIGQLYYFLKRERFRKNFLETLVDSEIIQHESTNTDTKH